MDPQQVPEHQPEAQVEQPPQEVQPEDQPEKLVMQPVQDLKQQEEDQPEKLVMQPVQDLKQQEGMEEIQQGVAQIQLQESKELPQLPQLSEQKSSMHDELFPPLDLQPSYQSFDEYMESNPVLLKQASESDPQAPDSTHEFFQQLSGFRVNIIDFPENSTYFQYGESPAFNESYLQRINKEIKAMGRCLPCEPTGSIFVVLDSANLGKIRALISGNIDTPYEHGLFLFDLALPENYPINPPKVNIMTNGNHTLRFNPNLYSDGFVCLSIINTWDGNPEQMWNSEFSTLMQVFLSIQTLVMNEQVIQKEPGYQDYQNNSPENRDYNSVVKYGNMKYAIADMVINPPVQFQEVVKTYFKLKKNEILQTTQKWVNDTENYGELCSDYLVLDHNSTTMQTFRDKGVHAAFLEAFEEMKQALDSLE